MRYHFRQRDSRKETSLKGFIVWKSWEILVFMILLGIRFRGSFILFPPLWLPPSLTLSTVYKVQFIGKEEKKQELRKISKTIVNTRSKDKILWIQDLRYKISKTIVNTRVFSTAFSQMEIVYLVGEMTEWSSYSNMLGIRYPSLLNPSLIPQPLSVFLPSLS